MSHSYIQHYRDLLQHLDQQSLRRKLKISESASAPEMVINGRSMLTFCSNDYLGLANHAELTGALIEGAQLYGAGSGASHMISGHNQAHEQLEKKLADTQASFIPQVKALFFSTGYMANLAAITGLCSLGNQNATLRMTIFSEELNHASLIDGVRLASKQNNAQVKVYPHHDLKQLEKLLSEDPNPFKLIVTDAVFSMDGDIAPIDQLLELAEKFNALILIDDAHGFGLLGQQGLGALDMFNIRSNNPNSARIIYMGTLGKAAGLSGAFIAAEENLVEWIMQKGRTYIYTTASPPLVAHGLLKSLELMAQPHHRQQLYNNIQYWQKNLQLKKWQLMPSSTAIQPIVIGSNADALKVAQLLDHQNIWVPAIRPPTVAEGTARLRVTLSATHTESQINQLIEALHAIENDF
ncbi:8-amino-7-oxononanoate synthase [Polynucleobacter sp. 30F-ANTBAC]|uniref:aminotransferase class I/II-fold pyridoxal phosphate-dependent enzyme n=1 Tax=Polynucleobacter sp. 30F-ANTBAC TaxID=2689095 RepID=UPI001C0C8B88|nr:8-amino-7-oxononanoate synthase [Polynucleobacter sp. 30F-ANTBAC]MBU3599824.1 8-amino-7-oxononanoate synthase [Polynucleobacter sp. 30F-ANTBAC]